MVTPKGYIITKTGKVFGKPQIVLRNDLRHLEVFLRCIWLVSVADWLAVAPTTKEWSTFATLTQGLACGLGLLIAELAVSVSIELLQELLMPCFHGGFSFFLADLAVLVGVVLLEHFLVALLPLFLHGLLLFVIEFAVAVLIELLQHFFAHAATVTFALWFVAFFSLGKEWDAASNSCDYQD